MTRFFAERRNYGDTIDIYAIQGGDQRGDIKQRAKAVEWVEAKLGEFAPEPMLQILPADAQRLMDELWAVGLRPSQMVEGEGERGALQSHLADLRAIVMHTLKVPKA